MADNFQNFTLSRFSKSATPSNYVPHAQAKVPANARGKLTATLFRIGVFVVLAALTLLGSPDVARAENHRNCAWPIEFSPEGVGNMVLPESFARDFVIPFDVQYETMTIKGSYPNVRHFSLVVYEGATPRGIAGDLYDAQIAPDSGSINPFVKSQAGSSRARGNAKYTVVISRSGETSGNTIKVSQDFQWVFLRMYVPSADQSLSGQSLIGGVPLPSISLTAKGATQELAPCSPINEVQDTSAYIQDMFQGVALVGDEGTPSSDQLWFAPPTRIPARLMPNPHNKYVAMIPGKNYQPGRIVVIHGKAPGTPTPMTARRSGCRLGVSEASTCATGRCAITILRCRYRLSVAQQI